MEVKKKIKYMWQPVHVASCARGAFLYMPHAHPKYIPLDVTALWIGLDRNEAKCRNLKATFLYSQEENSTPTHFFVAKKMTHDRVTMIHEHINVGNKPINSLFSYNAGG